jgi:hypothetical protein
LFYFVLQILAMVIIDTMGDKDMKDDPPVPSSPKLLAIVAAAIVIASLMHLMSS